jgi:hypothetical protein
VSIKPVGTDEHIQWSDLRAPMLYRRFAPADPSNRHGAQKNFWYEYQADKKLLYVNYSAVVDAQDESVAAFFDRVFKFADSNPVD